MAPHHQPDSPDAWPAGGTKNMKIIGVEGLTSAQMQQELQRGARFVIYQYCISVIILTFKRGTDIYFIPAGTNAVTRGLPWSVLTFFLGWWGIPWGPIYTIQSLWTNFGGGRDVTNQILASMGAQATQMPQARNG
jgi:hypothetical protein